MDTISEDFSSEAIRVLHLDDEEDFTDLTSRFLEKESQSFDIVTEGSPAEALDRIESGRFDCIVSDYDMPGQNGLEFLESVRENHPDLPFILFTGKGSEEIASDAISRGVTDYLQKGSGTDQYTVLANRIKNSVSQRRAEEEIEQQSEWYSRILEHSSDYILIVNGMGKVRYVSPAIERVMGYEPLEVLGSDAFEYIHPDDLEEAAESLTRTTGNSDQEVTAEFRAIADDGSVRWLEARGRDFLEDDIINGVMVNVRDITKRKTREQTVERQKKRLRELNSFLSHDVRNQLNVIDGYVKLGQTNEVCGDEFDSIADAVERMKQLIDKVQKLAKSEREVSDPESVALDDIAQQCWESVISAEEDTELIVDSSVTFEADRERLQSFLENLLVNAVKHGGPDVTVHVGSMDDGDGFYVEDDGTGISPDERDKVFEVDYTTTEEGTGLGLAIVKRVADAHDWTIQVSESDAGGARFEISNIDDQS